MSDLASDSEGTTSSLSEDGVSPEDQAAGGDSPGSEASERSARGERMTASSQQLTIQNSQPTLAASRTRGKKRKREIPLDDGQRKAYRKLQHESFDASCKPQQGNIEQLTPSQLGGSYWTTAEKESLFAALVRHGTDNLPALSKAIVTKSQPETRLYLLLLREQYQRLAVRKLPSLTELGDVPASLEIDEHCEGVLHKAAIDVARRAFHEEVEAEQQLFGSQWLIDETSADEIEDDEADPDEAEADPEDDTKGELERAPTNSPYLVDGRHASGIHANSQSLELLDLYALLQLSRTMFMNGYDTDNWHAMDDPVDIDVAMAPAIFRSALEDLYDITVQTTRRLVQATISQAMSRIRAKDGNSTPQNVVTQGDARTAADVLGLDDWKNYWITAPRRCGVHVYSEADRYRDGRPTERTGVRLTYDEIEDELGMEEHQKLRRARARHQDSRPFDLEDDDSDSGAGSERSSVNSTGKSQTADDIDPELARDHFLDTLDAQAGEAESRSIIARLKRRGSVSP